MSAIASFITRLVLAPSVARLVLALLVVLVAAQRRRRETAVLALKSAPPPQPFQAPF